MIAEQVAPPTERQASSDEVALLQRMLEIESPSGREATLADYLCQEMHGRGLRAHIDAVGNAIGESGEGGPQIMLLGHMDTAPGRVPVRRDGPLLYGRGAVDAKGPLAAFICAAARLGSSAGVRLSVVGAVEEESATSRGARQVAIAYRPDLCIIGEPSRWDRVTLGYKGRLLVSYTLEQGSVHSAAAVPTAAQRAAEFWIAVAELARTWGGTREFERLTPTLRRIHGESDGLTDSAHLELSLRVPPGCDTGIVRRQLQALSGAATVAFGGDEPAHLAEKNTPLVRAFLSAIRAQGATPSFALKTGTSDMNIVGPVWGCPILAYGPGDSSLDHTPNEHIHLDEYGRAINVLEAVLHSIARTYRSGER